MSQEDHKQTTKEFVKNQERKSRKTVKDHYDSISALCWEFDYLDDLLARLKNKKECYKFDVIDRNDAMDEISERMVEIIEDINLYKECINVEKKEMKRIHNIWGYGYTNDEYDSEYEKPYTEEDEELEEPLKIKYNETLDIFEDLSELVPPNPHLYYEYEPRQSNEVSTGGF
jgi:hypothetical protein